MTTTTHPRGFTLQSKVNSTYAPDFDTRRVVEVDYGVFWTNKAAPEGEQTGWRVTYVEHDHVVRAVRGDVEVVLAEDVVFAVVETILSESFSLTGNRREGEVWWAWACNNGADISNVTSKLKAWQGARERLYTGKDYDAAEVAFAKTYASHNGYYGAGGGWIYGPNGKPVEQGWCSFYSTLVRSHRVRVVAVDAERSYLVRKVIFQVAR